MTNDNRGYFLQKIAADDIPIELIEQIKTSDWTPERYLDFLRVVENSPLQFIFGIFHGDDLLGYVWCEANLLEMTLFIDTVSIKKQFKLDKKVSNEIIRLLKTFLKESGLRKIRFLTDRPAFFLRNGFKKSKQLLLELED